RLRPPGRPGRGRGRPPLRGRSRGAAADRGRRAGRWDGAVPGRGSGPAGEGAALAPPAGGPTGTMAPAARRRARLPGALWSQLPRLRGLRGSAVAGSVHRPGSPGGIAAGPHRSLRRCPGGRIRHPRRPGRSRRAGGGPGGRPAPALRPRGSVQPADPVPARHDGRRRRRARTGMVAARPQPRGGVPGRPGRPRPMRVVAWGTYDLGKPRNRILLRGLRENGVEVVSCHSDIWGGVEDKSRVRGAARLGRLLRWLVAYPALLIRYLRLPRHDAVLVGYLGQLDVLLLWPLARARGVPVVWDVFLSLHDTVVGDRRLVSPGHPLARLLFTWEWLACRAADRLLMDTRAHAAFLAETFRLDPARVSDVPVGVEPEVFPPA